LSVNRSTTSRKSCSPTRKADYFWTDFNGEIILSFANEADRSRPHAPARSARGPPLAPTPLPNARGQSSLDVLGRACARALDVLGRACARAPAAGQEHARARFWPARNACARLWPARQARARLCTGRRARLAGQGARPSPTPPTQNPITADFPFCAGVAKAFVLFEEPNQEHIAMLGNLETHL